MSGFRGPVVASVVAIVGAGLFGVADAILWNLQDSSGAAFWVANMSSLYLLLSFVGGQSLSRSRADTILALLLGATLPTIALAAFYLWQVAEHGVATTTAMLGLRRYLPGALTLGPLFGVLGLRWRRTRSWYAAVAITGAFVLEPWAWRAHLGFVPGPHWVWPAEVIVGVAIGLWCLTLILRRRRSRFGVITVGRAQQN